MLPRKKDSKAASKFKGAQNKKSEMSVSGDFDVVCHSENPAVRAVWDMYAPPLIEAKIVNFVTEPLFLEVCNTIVILRALNKSIMDEDNSMFEKVQAYGEGGEVYQKEVVSDRVKEKRKQLAVLQGLYKDLSLRPRDMAGLWNLDKREDDSDELI